MCKYCTGSHWLPTISEARYEQMLDKRVQARLRNDPAYLHAEHSGEQSLREEEIERQEEDNLTAEYRVER